MALVDEIEKILNEFGEKLAIDYNDAFDKVLSQKGNPQEADLKFFPELDTNDGVINIKIFASDKYWRYVESGRNGKEYKSTDPKAKPNPKQPPNAPLKKWIKKNALNPSKVIFDLTVEYNKKKGFTKRKVTKLPFDKAAKQMSFLIARSIKKKGIKPKPFEKEVREDGRLDELQNKLSELIGTEIELNFSI